MTRGVSILSISVGLVVLTCCSGTAKKMESQSPLAERSVGIEAEEMTASNDSAEYIPLPLIIEEPREDICWDVVEEMPVFPGGTEALFDFLANNVQYPPMAEDVCIQGRVIITLVIDKDGSVTEPQVVKSLDPAFDQEALRVVKRMPKWTPGKQNGKAAKVKYTLPVTFRLE